MRLHGNEATWERGYTGMSLHRNTETTPAHLLDISIESNCKEELLHGLF